MSDGYKDPEWWEIALWLAGLTALMFAVAVASLTLGG